MSEINFMRFKCDNSHITAIRSAEPEHDTAVLSHCEVCGSESTTKIDSQTISADIIGDFRKSVEFS